MAPRCPAHRPSTCRCARYPSARLGWQKRPARGQGTVPHPPCPAPINLFLARGVGSIPLPSKEIKGAQGDLRAAGQTGWRPGRSRVRLLRRLLQVLPVVVPKTRREGTYTRFHTSAPFHSDSGRQGRCHRLEGDPTPARFSGETGSERGHLLRGSTD